MSINDEDHEQADVVVYQELPEDEREMTEEYKKYLNQKKRLWVFVGLIVTGFIVFVTVSILYPDNFVMEWWEDVVEWTKRDVFWGSIFLLFFMAFLTLPFIPGFNPMQAIFGYLYGVWPGIFYCFAGTFIGTSWTYFLCSYVFRDFSRMYAEEQKVFKALKKVLLKKSFALMAIYRALPYPWAPGNMIFAVIDGVSPIEFHITIFFALPKQLLAVYIGHKVASSNELFEEDLGDPDGSEHANYILAAVAFISIAGMVTYVKRELNKELEQFEADEKAKKLLLDNPISAEEAGMEA